MSSTNQPPKRVARCSRGFERRRQGVAGRSCRVPPRHAADGLEERPGRQATEKFARAAGTPFISFFSPPEMLALAREAGFREAQHVSAASLTQRYFAGRTDGLRPSSSEELLVATT